MKVKVTTQKRENYVLIEVIGEVDYLLDMKSLATRHLLEMINNNVNKIVVDSRELIIPHITKFSLSLIHHYIDPLPLELKHFNITIVINKVYQELGRLWKAACNNRGFEGFNVFYDLDEAINWTNE